MKFITGAISGLALAWSMLGTGWAASDFSQYLDGSDGRDWPGPGRTFGEQHFSPLDQINKQTIKRLGLVWALDLPLGTSVTQPIEVGGVLYFATFYSLVHAVDVRSGKELWTYDAKVPQANPRKLSLAWGTRGVAWWNGKIYVGTQDGRLIALDAANGKLVWSVQTTGADDGRYITGAPRVFNGKVIIGHGGADVAPVRGYVTTYDAETGKQLWRFYLVPGNPADGFEDKAQEMAAKTWFGEWWKYGGGGTAWNAMSYDPETDSVIIGTGDGAPWNRKIRSKGKGDNLFLSSIVALDANTGAYKWHYQTNPGESWDYNAVMDLEFADLTIGGRLRKVLITAPKNGFVYVIDRTNGQFISAMPFEKVTWAKGIDKQGRPIEMPNSRYETGPFVMAPSPLGAHNWLPMAFSPKTNLVYIPAISLEVVFTDKGIDASTWHRTPYYSFDGAVGMAMPTGPAVGVSSLVAWNPITQKQVWRVPKAATVSAGVMATGGDLVFQGDIDSSFSAFDATSGQSLWSFNAGAPVMAPPISYEVDGKQYVTVLTGAGSSLLAVSDRLKDYRIDYRTQKRRVLTFALDGNLQLPKSPVYEFVPIKDADYRANPAQEQKGAAAYGPVCLNCHGNNGIPAGLAPDLRASSAILSQEAFDAILRDGALVERGMPLFDRMPDQTRADIRQYVRKLAHDAVVEDAKRSKKPYIGD